MNYFHHFFPDCWCPCDSSAIFGAQVSSELISFSAKCSCLMYCKFKLSLNWRVIIDWSTALMCQQYRAHHLVLLYFCSSQPSIVHWLGSPIFPCSVVRLSRHGDTWPYLTSTCPGPPNPYIFWKLMIIAIKKWIRNTNTKTKTNTKTMTKTKTPRE